MRFMMWNEAVFSASVLASIAVVSKAAAPENVDVIIIGAGAAGAAAAREFEKYNKKARRRKENGKTCRNNEDCDEITWYLLESQDRIGGRIKDIKLGGQQGMPATRYSGGFANEKNTDPPKNIGCHCAKGSRPCPKFNVEVGAGWFTGYNGIEVHSCQNQAQRTQNRRDRLRAEKRKEDGPWKEAICAGKDPFTDPETVGRALEEIDCSNCPPLYNTQFAISQGQGPPGYGNMEHPLKVHCPAIDWEEDYYGFLETGMYYGLNPDPNSCDEKEMKPMDRYERNLPGFDKEGNFKLVGADRFLDTWYRMIDKCVDWQAYQYWYQYAYYGKDTSPFYNRADEMNTKSWIDFDVGFDTMPDKMEFWEQALGWRPDPVRRIEWCNNYHDMVKDFLENEDEISLDAQKMYNFYKNFEYFSEFLSGQYMSFGNFGDDGNRAFGYDIAYSIDQRGLKQVVEKIMPPVENIKMNHRVTKVHWRREHDYCSPEYPVLIEVDAIGEKGQLIPMDYCAKRVISTVSLGVMAEEKKDNIFQPRIKMDKSPFTGMGKLIKVYFRFPETFWKDDLDQLYITYAMKEDFRLNETDKTVKGQYFYNLDKWFINHCDHGDSKFCDTHSLFSFMSTDDLDLIGLNDPSVTDEEISNKIWGLLEPLRYRYGDAYVEPNCWEFHDWTNDVNARGAYGVWKRGATYYDHIDFFKPRKQKETKTKVLYLSGEASCFNIWGFIEGAHEAGVRDAKVVINDLLGIDESVFSACGLQWEFDKCFLETCKNENPFTGN